MEKGKGTLVRKLTFIVTFLQLTEKFSKASFMQVVI